MNENVDVNYLLTHGFKRYFSKEDGYYYDIPFSNEEDLHFVEINIDRNMFVIILSPSYEHKGHFDHSIYVQEDAGCGFVCIPERWWDLPIEYFESIYYGIRGEKPKETPFDSAEIILPKQLQNKQL